MNRLLPIIKHLLIGLMLIFLFDGCALYDEFFGKSPDEKPPEELLSEGMRKLEKGRYEAATEDFQAIKDRYPYSRHAITAELKIADSHYKINEFGAAFDAYDEFEKLHPRDKNIPYVIYQKGMCHFRQVTSIDRDQSYTLKAREEFERLVKRFPKDEYAKSARVNIRKSLIYLAEYELYVGHYYFKMGKYRPAMGRYMYLIKNYPDMGQYHEALEYMSKCKEKLAEEEMQPK
ncbi:outer membrane protein assembly factor BamD [Thermodesulfobacteriota bacterium]